MRRRRRFRKWAKWACTVGAATTVGVAAVSGLCYCDVDFASNDSSMTFGAVASEGLLGIDKWDGGPGFPPSRGWNWSFRWAPGWSWGKGKEFGWKGGLRFVRGTTGVLGYLGIGASAAYPVLLTTIPAALLWYADRRRYGPGSCTKCGYDRRGLAADAKCPECGAGPRQ